MPVSSAKRKPPLVITRAELAERLRERAPVIEESLIDSVRAMIDPRQYEVPEYTSCQREAIEAVLAASLDEVERPGELEAIPMPVAALARHDAQCGVGLETVIRRCMIIDRRMTEFIVGEAEGLSARELRQVMQTWGGHVDRLVQFVSREYEQETERLQKSPEQRLAEWVQGLLDGEEPVEGKGDAYRFTAWHLAMIVGPGVPANELQGLAARLESQALIVARADSTQWVWLGRQRPIPYAEIKRQLPVDPELTVAVGESRWGIAGWRVSHREARAAQQVVKYQPRSVVRCGEVALVAALTRDEILCRALVDAYLRPLDGPGSTGSTLRSTLRAYFAAGGNTKAAAASLDVDRHTIHRRLRKIEDRLGVYVDECHAELEIALRVESLLPPQGVTEAHVACR
jgi:PucR C-terminal helix-turn-helix domain/GGDEF-like domain